MSALNDLITGAFLGKVVVGTVEKAVLELAELYRRMDWAARVITELRNKPFTAAYTHSADKWLEAYHGKPPEGMGSFDAAYPISSLPDEATSRKK